jgi:hypothetical protein
LAAVQQVASSLEASSKEVHLRGMEDISRRRRQNEQPVHATSNTRYQQSPPQQQQQQQQQRQSFADASSDARYRPTSAVGRGMGSSAGYAGGYYSESAAGGFSTTAMPQSTLSYQQTPADYGQADTRQSQGFSANTYNPTAIMYNVQQAAGAQNPSVYDTSQQFQSRQPAAALQMMATDVTTPYFPSEQANPATGSSTIQPQSASTTTPQTVYQQPALQNYTTGMTGLGGMAGQTATAADVSMEDQEYTAAPGLDEAYASYLSELKDIFQNIRGGVLAAASESLLNVSDWLLSHVAELGMQVNTLNSLPGQIC